FTLDPQFYPDELKLLNQQGLHVMPLETTKKITWIGVSTPHLTIVVNTDTLPYAEVFFSFDLVDRQTKRAPIEDEDTYNLIADIFDVIAQNQSFYVFGRDEFAKSIQYTFSMLLITGLYMTIIFLLAVILILYFKQISQGQEDRRRFKIMKQVGLEPSELRQIINSQVRIMFFSPLITAL
ncbi:ABC-type antimicrobial peptide transport system, permease component, partial [gut metagenome]